MSTRTIGYGTTAIFLVVALSLGGCPTPTRNNGVVRSADLTAMPSMECVREVIASTPGVADVQYRNLGGTDHIFRYDGGQGSHLAATLRLLWKADGTVNFRHYLLDYSSPPQADIDVTRPVMQHIEQAIATKCGIPSLPSQIQEECHGVDCGPLS